MTEFKTEDGATFVYDFELMSMEQALVAEAHFKIWEKTFKVLPATPDELQLATNQSALKNGYAALLLERNADGTYKLFDATQGANLSTLKRIKGADARVKLEECKLDFFQQSGIVTANSNEQLSNLMTVVKEMPKEEQSLMFQMILDAVKEHPGNS